MTTERKWRWGWTVLIVVMVLVGCLVLLASWFQFGSQQKPTSWGLSGSLGTLGSLSPDDTEIEIFVGVGSTCDRFDAVDVIETDTTVDIRAWITSTGPQHACKLSLSMESVVVTLDDPLGDRTLTGCSPPGANVPSATPNTNCGAP